MYQTIRMVVMAAALAAAGSVNAQHRNRRRHQPISTSK